MKYCPNTSETILSPKKSKLPFLLFAGLIIIGACLMVEGSIWLFRDIKNGTEAEVEANVPEMPTEIPDVVEAVPTNTPVAPTIAYTLPANPTETPLPTDTSIPLGTPKPTSSPVPTELPYPQPIDQQINSTDGAELVFVPAGEFTMGVNEDDDPLFWGAEGPAHEVDLDEFWIYRMEVTNEMYQMCVAEGKCPRPSKTTSSISEDYYGNEKYHDYPVIHVSYTHAVSYCNWAGGKLPTEAQWEKAARGTQSYSYPWGDQGPDSELANLCGSECIDGSERDSNHSDDFPGPAPVGGFPLGASPYSAFDMAGNVWEWVFDYFDSYYYSRSSYDNPRGPANGTRRVIRGGSWSNPRSGARTVARASLNPDDFTDTVGFRCVSNP
jgi:formylglycine-generating enzyme required for sulfatase activity